MTKGQSLQITAAAAAELGRQAAVAGTPGMMHLDLIEGGCERWTIRLRPGHLAGVPIARADGVTVYAPEQQWPQLCGVSLDYRGDLSGGGFLVHPPEGHSSCACGAAFGPLNRGGSVTQ
ncbi:MAG: AIR synthase [Synechococcaceae bacterium WB9_2_112]|nr:AIR synthase [Synechococcaceae bacterium WB9_2_112]